MPATKEIPAAQFMAENMPGYCWDCIPIPYVPTKEDWKHAAPILLSSGRIIVHAKCGNGSWLATPSTGPESMTDEEWTDYDMKLHRRHWDWQRKETRRPSA